MIEIAITHKDDTGSRELGRIEIFHLEEDNRPSPDDAETGDYEVRLATGSWLDYSVSRRGLRGYKRLKYSVFAMLVQALGEFTDNKELFHLDARRSSNVAREQRRTVREIPRRES